MLVLLRFSSLRFIHRQCNSLFKSQNVTSILLPSNLSILLNILYLYEILILLIRTLSVSSLPPYSLFHKAHLLRTFCSIFCTVFSSLYRFHSDCLGDSYAFRKQSQFWYSLLSLAKWVVVFAIVNQKRV